MSMLTIRIDDQLDAVREALQPYAETAGCVTDEDFFQKIS